MSEFFTVTPMEKERNNNAPDPYNSSLYQANLIKQDKRVYMQMNTDSSKEESKTQIHIDITLVNGGVEVSYNPFVISFANDDDEIKFRREINSFFIRNNFRLSSILFPINVYKCGTRESRYGDVEFIFSPNDTLLSTSETNTLNLIISSVLHRSSFT